MPGISLAEKGSTLSYSLAVGYLSEKIGGYGKFKSNYLSNDIQHANGPYDYYFDETYSKTRLFSASAGIIIKAPFANNLLAYAGIGYGTKQVVFKSSLGELYIIDSLSSEGIMPEAGLMLKINNLFVGGVGISHLFGKQKLTELHISMGFIF